MRAILTYHSLDHSGSPISVAPDTFRAHLDALQARGVRLVTLEDLLHEDDRADAAALTFDDGFATVRSEAGPLLEARGAPATIFVVPGHVGGDNAWDAGTRVPRMPLLDWEELGRLAERGFAVGAHTRTHPRLTTCSDGRLREELEGAAEDIAAALGRRPTAFAYPYGDVNDRVARAAADVYQFACTTELCPVTAPERPERLPRLDAYYLRSGDWIGRWGGAAFRGYLGCRRVLRAVRGSMA